MRRGYHGLARLFGVGFGLFALSCSSPERTAGIINPHADEESERAGREPVTDAGRAYAWRRLAWLDEDGRIAPGVLRTALDQREANMAAWAGSSRIAGIAPT
ncbi:MAG: hypothetical protein IT432_08250, partial [Phycisphaerales bacterium]|nr:hypothetical protein [Phycisphaerales bacterium]